MGEKFRHWMPIEAFEKADAPPGRRLRIRGIISTEHPDLEGEVVLQDGMDLRPLAKRGWLNDNHDKRTHRVLGVPERVYRVEVPDENGRMVKATAVEGFLLDDPEGRALWEKARALQKAGRHFGFSVDGSTLDRDPADRRRITRSVIREVAITRCPANPHTRLEALEKALQTLSKGMTVGDMPPAPGVATPGRMAPLVGESLEGVRNPFGFDWEQYAKSWRLQKSQVEQDEPPKCGCGTAMTRCRCKKTADHDGWSCPGCGAHGTAEAMRKTPADCRRRPLTKSDALRLVQRRFPRATPEQAERLLRAALHPRPRAGGMT